MATQHTKKIDTGNSKPEPKGTYLHKDNWEVMKPFVHFAVKATAVIGSTLYSIVKLVPKAIAHKEEDNKKDRIIKI